MAKLLSSTDLAIALADKVGDLRFVERASRFGGTFIALEDAVGLIEVHGNRMEADARLSAIRKAVA
jgi:hypothetical protein